MNPRQAHTSVIFAALLATAGVWLPGALLYMDSPCHLLELQELALRVIPEQGWVHGWSAMANAGGDIGGGNATLPWALLGLLGWLGLSVGPLMRLATVGATACAGLGALALGRRLGLSPTAAALAGALVAVMPIDLLGIGGGLAGMWPYRLANGLLLLGLARLEPERPRVGGTALWLAAVLLCHAYSGVVAFGVLGLLILARGLRGAWREAGLLGAAGLLATLIALPWWLPQLQGGATAVQEITRLGPAALLAMLTLPVRPHDLLTGAPWTLLGGGWSVPASVLLGLGLALGLVRLLRAPRAVPPMARLLLLAVAGLLLLALLGGLGLLGPNPWRHTTQGRTALALLAAAGLAPWLVSRGRVVVLVAVLAIASLGASLRELPWARDDLRDDLRALSATWAALAEAEPAGRVYHQETFRDPSWSGPLAWSHAGAMLGVAQGLPVMGSWYGVSPVPTVPYTMDQGVALMGTLQSVVLEDPAWLLARFRRFGVGAVVTVEPELEALLRASGDYRLVAEHAPFAAFLLELPPLAPLALASPSASAAIARHETTRVVANVTTAAPVDFVLRQAWDPGWEAKLDGAPVAIQPGPADGLITGTLPGSGELQLGWKPRSKPLAPIGLLGLLLAAGLAWWERRRG